MMVFLSEYYIEDHIYVFKNFKEIKYNKEKCVELINKI